MFLNKTIHFGKTNTEVINVKEKGNQLFRDKFVLVMLVLGLLTIVAAEKMKCSRNKNIKKIFKGEM